MSDGHDVHVIAKLYQQAPCQPLQFKLDVGDSRPYELKDVITNVNLEYNQNARAHSIADDVKETLDMAVGSLRRSNVAGASAALVAQQRRRGRVAQRTAD